MASAALHASRVESGSGFWWLSMAMPPKSCDSIVNLRSEWAEMVSRTRTACAVTSGPAGEVVEGQQLLVTLLHEL